MSHEPPRVVSQIYTYTYRTCLSNYRISSSDVFEVYDTAALENGTIMMVILEASTVLP